MGIPEKINYRALHAAGFYIFPIKAGIFFLIEVFREADRCQGSIRISQCKAFYGLSISGVRANPLLQI
jgi:hypothetical protein